MTPLEIKIEILKTGVNQNQIAKKVGVTPTLVSQVIYGIRPTRYVREAIAEVIGKPVEELWPCTTSDARLRPNPEKSVNHVG
jgi:lambda repressor-like predicted transcriptional regulator